MRSWLLIYIALLKSKMNYDVALPVNKYEMWSKYRSDLENEVKVKKDLCLRNPNVDCPKICRHLIHLFMRY